MSSYIDSLKMLIEADSSTEKICSQIVSDLERGTSSILVVVENLGYLLTNQDVSIRRGGIQALSNVLQTVSPSYVSAKEHEHLVQYFANCLADHHSFIPAVLRGFLALAKMDNLPDGVASKIFTILNLNFTCQSQTQADRFVCYELLDILMERKSKELQTLGPDFVCGYLSFIDGERDPRNLMYLFARLPKFYQNFPPGHLLEDSFETASCYFPVDFHSNPKDPRGIRREDLSEALIPCLVAIDEFCSLTVTLALDKLMSDLKIAKIDSLLLLKRGFSVFSPEKLCPMVEEILSTLLSRLKPGVAEAEVQDLCIDVLGALMKYLSDNKKTETLNKTLLSAFTSVEYFLRDLRSGFFTPAIKFLAKIASSCDEACRYIITEVTPKLLSFKSESDSDSVAILESFKQVLVPCSTFKLEMNELLQVWPQVVELFLMCSRSRSAEVKISAIEGTTKVARLFSRDQRETLYSILCQSIKLEDDPFVRQKCVDCVRIAAIHFADEVQTVLKNELASPENGSSSDSELKKRIFHCWCHLAPVPGFLTYLEQSAMKYIVSDKHEHTAFVMEALRNLVMRERDNVDFLRSLHRDVNLTRHLMDWWHEGCNAISDERGQVFEDEQVAHNLEFIVCIIVRVLDEKLQLENAVRYLNLTNDYSKRFMNSFQYLNDNDDLSTPKVHCSLSIITFESIVNGLLPTVLDKTLSQCLTQIVKYLSTLATYCSRPICCEVACRSLATIFNKLSEGPHLNEELEYVFEYTSTTIECKTGTLQLNATKLMLFVAKSLLLKGYLNLNKWLDKLLVLITNKNVCCTVTEGFRKICREDEYFLNASCHCTVRLFYRQRLFSFAIPKLVAIASTADEEIKTRCAISAAYLLEELPQSVVTKHFNEIVPLLAELLSAQCQGDISLIAVQKLTSLLPVMATTFEEYIQTFLPKLLSLAQNASNMKVRMEALRCIGEYSKIQPMSLLPHKTRVIHELAPCIDDRKRLVRKEAVKARTRWIVLGVS